MGRSYFYFWWARQDLNLEPKNYEFSALTIELQAQIFKSYHTAHNLNMNNLLIFFDSLVHPAGLKPATSTLGPWRSVQLSYGRIIF